jgi:hypothetical protein
MSDIKPDERRLETSDGGAPAPENHERSIDNELLKKTHQELGEILDKRFAHLQEAKEKISPNLRGFIAPGLRLDITNKGIQSNEGDMTPEQITAYEKEIKEQFTNEGRHLGNPYHNPTHFQEVYDRAKAIVKPGNKREENAVEIAALWHDYDHPGKKQKEGMSVEDITTLYGEPGKDAFKNEEVLESVNAMIQEDNDIVLADNLKEPDVKKHKKIRELLKTGDHTTKITLTDEEISALKADASLRKKNSSLETRSIVNGLIKATDFLNPRNGPKTNLEWQFKMADMANFTKDIDSWLKTAVEVGIEAPWGPPPSVEKFINGEIFFLEFLVSKPMLENPAVKDLFGANVREAWQEKINFLKACKQEIEDLKAGKKTDQSEDVKKVIEALKPLINTVPAPLWV